MTPRITFLARDSVQSTRPRSGWHTAMYLSMVKETVNHVDVPPAVHKYWSFKTESTYKTLKYFILTARIYVPINKG